MNMADCIAQSQPVRVHVKISSLDRLLAGTESIRNTAWLLRKEQCCTIETAQNYYNVCIEQGITTVSSISKPASGLWMSIKKLASSLFTDKQSREAALKQKLNAAMAIAEAQSKAHCKQNVMNKECGVVLAGMVARGQIRQEARISCDLLMQSLENLCGSMISRMQDTDNQQPLEALTRAHDYLNEQRQAVLLSFVNFGPYAAWEVLKNASNLYGADLAAIPAVSEALHLLHEQLIQRVEETRGRHTVVVIAEVHPVPAGKEPVAAAPS